MADKELPKEQKQKARSALQASAEPQAALKKEPKKEKPAAAAEGEVLIRVYGYDIPASKNLYTGLTKIKGISWSLANALCHNLGFPHAKKIHEFSKEDIRRIEQFLGKLDVPEFLKNRRKDRETGETTHLYGTDLEMRREFDIKRLKEMKSYRGMRHALKLPVRGQRTRSHFRTKKVSTGMKKARGKKP